MKADKATKTLLFQLWRNVAIIVYIGDCHGNRHHLRRVVWPRAEYEEAHLHIVREVTHAHGAVTLEHDVGHPLDGAIAEDHRQYVHDIRTLSVETKTIGINTISPDNTVHVEVSWARFL